MDNTLLANLDRIHTTELGVERIRKNLGLGAGDPVAWCREKIRHADSVIRRRKNWYVFAGNVKITVNAHSYTIITAHKESPAKLNNSVENIWNAYPERYRECLVQIRALIHQVAAENPQVGQLAESLKWGQPTYSPVTPKTGSPIRLDRFGEDRIAVFFHCRTSLVESFRTLFRDTLEFSKNRAIVIDPTKELPTKELALCIEMALTYHLSKVKK